jgi:hypothetical protein
VSAAVGNVKNNFPELRLPADGAPDVHFSISPDPPRIRLIDLDCLSGRRLRRAADMRTTLGPFGGSVVAGRERTLNNS